jgi:hypothetical protein
VNSGPSWTVTATYSDRYFFFSDTIVIVVLLKLKAFGALGGLPHQQTLFMRASTVPPPRMNRHGWTVPGVSSNHDLQWSLFFFSFHTIVIGDVLGGLHHRTIQAAHLLLKPISLGFSLGFRVRVHVNSTGTWTVQAREQYQTWTVLGMNSNLAWAVTVNK